MIKLNFTEHELEIINKHGCVCPAVAERAMRAAHLNFDDIEEINEHHEEHRWGSNADRLYRKRAVNKAIQIVASNPRRFM